MFLHIWAIILVIRMIIWATGTLSPIILNHARVRQRPAFRSPTIIPCQASSASYCWCREKLLSFTSFPFIVLIFGPVLKMLLYLLIFIRVVDGRMRLVAEESGAAEHPLIPKGRSQSWTKRWTPQSARSWASCCVAWRGALELCFVDKGIHFFLKNLISVFYHGCVELL